ncbi:hypothetical protein FQZ97_990820 [compost metagenome]
MAQFFELLAEPAWESALIVSHDAVNRILLAWAAGVGLKGIAAFEQDTACLNILDVDSLGPEVLGGIIRTPMISSMVGPCSSSAKTSMTACVARCSPLALLRT